MGTSTLLLVSIAVVVILCAALLVRSQMALRRHRQQIAALMTRLDAVEGKQVPGTPGRTRAAVLQTEPADGSERISSDADVLAGRTTYVAAMIDGAAPEELSAADKTIVCIHENLQRTLRPRELADELHVSLRSLERVLAATLECTPSQLITTMKMREARRLLESGAFRVSEVAYRLGYSSPAHFSARFKSFYRVTPSRLLGSR